MKDTLVYLLMKKLITGQRLTHLSFQDETGSYCLRSPIHVLSKKHGWNISRQWIKSTDKRYCQYWLKPEEIERIKAKSSATDKSKIIY